MGAPERAHRVSWRLHFGDIPDGLEILHKCDNPPCVRLSHLFLGTAGDNMRDCASKGRSGGAKLTWAKVRRIRDAYARGETQMSLAARFGVSQTNISDIITERVWAPVKRVVTKHHLRPDDVRAIREAFDDGETRRSIASRTGLHYTQITNIVLRKQWKHVA